MVDAEPEVASPAPTAAGLLDGLVLPRPAELLRSVGPRLLLDVLAPPIVFYGVWRATDNVYVGVAIGTVVSVLIYLYERSRGRPGLIAQFVLGFVLVQAIVGIATNSATAYLVQPAVLGAINGALWLGSVMLSRPLAGTFAQEVFPVGEEIRASAEYHTIFSRVSLLFGVFFIGFAAVQLVVLIIVGVGAFVATRVLDAVGLLAMIAYSVRYITAQLDRLPVE